MAKKLNIIIKVLVLVLLVGVIYFKNVESKRLILKVSDLEASLEKEVDKYGRLSYEYRALMVDYKDLSTLSDSVIEDLKLDVKRYKNLYQYTRIRTTVHDTLILHVTDTIIDGSNSRMFNYRDEWLNCGGVFLNGGDIKFNYSIINDLTLTYRWKRDRWYTKKYLVGSVVSNNPKVVVNKVMNFTIRQDDKFYNKKWFNLLTGFAVGVIGSKLLR